MKKLTDKTIKNLKPENKEYQVDGGNGLYIRVLPSGVKTFWYRYTIAGKRQKLSLGNYPYTSLADANDAHDKAKILVRQGIDPRLTVEPLAVIEAQELTFGGIAKQYLEWSKVNHSPAWNKIIHLTLNNDLLPHLSDRAATSVRRPDAIKLLEAMVERPGQAMNALKAARGAYGYALDRELVAINPFASIRVAKTIPAIAPKSRKRTLTHAEIRHVYEVIQEDTSTKRALLFILLTGQRPGEVAGMVWKEVAWGEGKTFCEACRRCAWWTIPPERSKNGLENRVFLSHRVVSLLPEQSENPIFMGPNGDSIRRDSLSHYVDDHDFFDLPRWTPHDLRRTAATGLSQIKCTDAIVDAVLNHTKKGTIGVYNRNEYDDEKSEWLPKWAEQLFEIVKKRG